MAKDHQAVIDQAVALVTKLKVTPKDNAVSRKLIADAAKTRKMLRSKSAKAFNKAYIDNEVAYHKAVIAAIETVLSTSGNERGIKRSVTECCPGIQGAS